MKTILFLQSEIKDPYKFYEEMLHEHPVYREEANRLWAIYSYEYCKAILNNPAADIPALNQNNKDGLNDYALLIAGQFARLSNDADHEIARAVAMLLFEKMKIISITEKVKMLLKKEVKKNETDWVSSICRKLPVIVVLKSFDFSKEDCDFISDKTEQLTKIMLPHKTPEQVAEINGFSKEIYYCVEKHLLNTGFYKSIINELAKKYKIMAEKIMVFCISNLIGLFIQSYDAGRGMLSNSFLQILKDGKSIHNITSKEYFKKSVIETLRFDPPIHNTRRIAVDNIILNNALIKKGDAILIVLAAANRDPQQFTRPGNFNIERANNNEHLTFGSGNHACVANQFSIILAVETLRCFFEQYKKVSLVEKQILYEPLINARLPKKILISFS
ncbi:MAG: cytochrome P450 [Ferruginibacter sp.]